MFPFISPEDYWPQWMFRNFESDPHVTIKALKVSLYVLILFTLHPLINRESLYFLNDEPLGVKLETRLAHVDELDE